MVTINRVVVDVGNPLSRTIAGRVQMAEQMLQMNLIKTPQQYFQVMNSGRLDSMFEGEIDELMLVKSENERMMEGEDVLASALDAHRLHIMEHKSVLSDPDLRKDPVLIQNVMNHILEHVELLRNTDPDLLALIGEQPLPPLEQPLAPTATGESVPIQPNSNIPNRTLERSPMQNILEEEEPTINTQQGRASVPSVPSPPPPFQNLPTNPQDVNV